LAKHGKNGKIPPPKIESSPPQTESKYRDAIKNVPEYVILEAQQHNITRF
jgi:hypothetical protein